MHIFPEKIKKADCSIHKFIHLWAFKQSINPSRKEVYFCTQGKLHQTSTNTPALPLLCRPVGNGCSRRSADLPPKMSPKLLFFVFKNSELMSGIFAMCWQIHTDAVLPPPMLLQRWFGPVFKSISSAKKDKQDRPKNLRTIWKVEDATPAYVNWHINPINPSSLIPPPYWFFVGTARPPMASCYAKTPNWQNQWPRYRIPKVPRAQTTPWLGELDFFPSKKMG